MYFKYAKAAVAASLSLILSAGAQPRLSQILPQTPIPIREPLTVDLFGAGRPDIFFNSYPLQGNLEENAIFIRNLGDRNFDHPRFTNFRYSKGGFTDGASSLVRLEPLAGRTVFFNEISSLGTSAVSTPTVVALDAAGRIQMRKALAPPSQSKWIPVDLDGDGVDEFLEESFNASDEFELVIHRRQAEGGYSSISVPIDTQLSIGNVTAIDLDGDGDLDLKVSSESNSSGITLLMRTGPQEFSPTPLFIANVESGAVFSDLNGDSLPDLHSRNSGSFVYFINDGGFSFGARQTRTIGAQSDGLPKLMNVVSESPMPATLQFSNLKDDNLNLVSIRFGTWETIAEQEIDISTLLPSSPDPRMLALEDFDGDGNDDALILSSTQILGRQFQLDTRRLSIAWGNGNGFSPAAYIHPAPISTQLHVTGNFDNLPGEDVIIGPDTEGNFAFLRNTGGGTFPVIRRLPEVRPPAGAPAGTIIAGLHAGDIDGDGMTDLAIDYEKFVSGEGYRTACGIAKGNGDGTFQLPVLPENAFGIIAQNPCGFDHLIDWDGDGDLDAIGRGRWRENLGGRFDGTTRFLIGGADLTDLVGNRIKQIITYAGDLDGDGSPDIASFVHSIEEISPSTTAGPRFTSKMAVAFNDGNGGIANLVEIPASLVSADIFGNSVISYAVFADMNSDGIPDLVTRELNSTDIFGNAIADNFWRKNSGGGSRDPASWLKLPFDGVAVPGGALQDFDGNGVLEWVSPSGFLRPDPRGPVASPVYNFISPVNLNTSDFLLTGDLDGDHDADFLSMVEGSSLVLGTEPAG